MTGRGNGRSDRQAPRFVGVVVGIGSGLGAAIAAITGDWYWVPVMLAACCTALGIRAGLSSTGHGD